MKNNIYFLLNLRYKLLYLHRFHIPLSAIERGFYYFYIKSIHIYFLLSQNKINPCELDENA